MPTKREFLNCEYARDKDNNFLPVIAKQNDHAIDAVRYALDAAPEKPPPF
jgi:phage terminase large subunit